METHSPICDSCDHDPRSWAWIIKKIFDWTKENKTEYKKKKKKKKP